MNYYNNNLELLKKTSYVLYQTVVNEEPILNLKISPLEEIDSFKVQYNGKDVCIHSVYDVNHEMRMTFASMNGSEKVVVILGVGKGYALKYVRENYPDLEKIIVVEPSLELFKNFLMHNDLVEHVKGVSVSFLVNKTAKEVGTSIGNYWNDSNSKIIHNLSYRILFEEYLVTMLAEAKKRVMISYGNYTFQYALQKTQVLNFMSNLKYGAVDNQKLIDVLKGKPLLVVAAGPSLNKNMHLINKAKEKAIVVAVGSAIKILEANGITPHFRMAFDPSVEEMKILDNVDTLKCPIIYNNNLFYGVLKEYKGSKLPVKIVSDYGWHYFLGKEDFKKNLLETGTSILIPAVDMGVIYGSSKIIFIGVDFSINKDEIYAKGFSEEQIEKDKKSFDLENMTATEGVNGDIVYMERSFKLHKIGLEAVIKANPRMKFIDATEGGVKIIGSDVMTLNQVLNDELEVNVNINSVNELFAVSKEEKDDYEERLKAFYDRALNEIDQIERLNALRVVTLKKIKRYHEKRIKTHFISEELKRIQNEVSDYEALPIYTDYIKPSLNAIFNGIYKKHRYEGYDKHLKIESELKKILEVTAEMDVFVNFVKVVVNLELEGKLEEEVKLALPYEL